MNSLNFNWFQPLPVVLPDQIRQNFLELAFDETPSWRAFNGDIVDVRDDKFIDRGRRALYFDRVNDTEKYVTWFEDTDLFQSLDSTRIKRNLTHIPSMVSVLFESSKKALGVQPHTDPACPESGWKQLRFNFMVQNAHIGGNPIIGDQMLSVPDGHGWYLFATDQWHRALPVKGNKARIIISLAYFIDPVYIPEAKRILTSSIK